jgi:hypothetical protein
MKSLQALEYFFPPDFVASLPEDSLLHRLLCEQRPESEIWRQHINDCLELALKYNLADADLVARLRKDDWDTFQAAINELKCAKFLEGLFGTNSLSWHPKGRKGKIGEFKIVLSNLDKPIFIEVKTVFPRAQEKLEEHISKKLYRYAKQIPIPSILWVSIKQTGDSENFSGKMFKQFLIEELSKINIAEVKEPLKLPDYKDDKTGLHIELKVRPLRRLPQSCLIGGIMFEPRWGGGKDYIRKSLRKAYEQRPEEKQPFLVILCSSTQFPIEEDDILNALLGTFCYPFYNNRTATEPEPFRKPDGFYQPPHKHQLSATGLYQEKLTGAGVEGSLEIYHNPFAANPLNYYLFEGKGVRQLVKIDDKQMGWKD